MDSEDLLGMVCLSPLSAPLICCNCRFKRTGKRDNIFLANKWGFVAMTGDRIIDGLPRHAGDAVDASLKRLGVDDIDIYLHVRFSLLAEM